jgi:hypothetical protein
MLCYNRGLGTNFDNGRVTLAPLDKFLECQFRVLVSVHARKDLVDSL